MARRWQAKKELSDGDFKYVELPGGVGDVVVSLQYGGVGSGSCQYTHYHYEDAMANFGYVQWKNVFVNAASSVDGVIPANATVVRFTASGGPQTFHAAGEGI